MYQTDELTFTSRTSKKNIIIRKIDEHPFSTLFESLQSSLDNYIVTNINHPERRLLFLKYLSKSNLIRYNSTVNDHQNSNYDYIYISKISSPEDVHSALQKHINKIVFFDCEKLLSHSNYLHLLNGATCFEQDLEGNQTKLKVNFRGTLPFVFEGKCIILSGFSKEALAKKRHLRLLLRNTVLV